MTVDGPTKGAWEPHAASEPRLRTTGLFHDFISFLLVFIFIISSSSFPFSSRSK